MGRSQTSILLAVAATAVGSLQPTVAHADPDNWTCGRTRDVSCFNCSAISNEDNSNSCAPHAGNNDDDWTMRFTYPTDVWVDVGVGVGSDLKIGIYVSENSICNPPIAQTSSSPSWGQDLSLGFQVQSNTQTYIAIEELDDDWDFSPSWRMNMHRFGCCPDNDGDGTYARNDAACPNLPANLRDCNDSDPVNAPNRTEVCDGRDNDCDGQIDDGLTFRRYYRDADGDGYGNAAAFVDNCTQPAGYVLNNTDCDDTRGNSRPGLPESCDGVDNNCNGRVDEGVLSSFYRDRDGDGFGDSSVVAQACLSPSGYVSDATDCDDTTAARRPGLAEYCDNLDNDCNGAVDDGAGQAWYRDADQDGRGNPLESVVQCSSPTGYVVSSDDCDDADVQRSPSLDEWCDGKDNDCNLIVDDGVGTLWYRDRDGDGRGDAASEVQACENPGSRVTTNDDCDDLDPNRSPLLDEVCDGVDNDCDTVVDDGVGPVWFRDADGDGHGNSTRQRQACSAPPGYISSSDDCDDGDALRHPGRTEVCDDRDNDCNVLVDDNATDALTWYRDGDGDQYGDPTRIERACDQPSGHVSNDGDCNDRTGAINPDATDIPYDNIDQDCDGVDVCDADLDGALAAIGSCGGDDCADGDPTIRPGVAEVIDGVDNNCDGRIDEETNASDDDRDGWSEAAGDCDDSDATVFPGAAEVCSGTDSDCDGVIDEDTFCSDDDGDGYSEDDGDCNDADDLVGPHMPELAANGIDDDCDGIVDAGSFDADGDGVTADAGDCDDTDADAVPGALEIADGIDNDCDGEVDEGTSAADDDGDGYSEEDGDCDDNNAAIYPGASEVMNGRDDDCNGITDDQGPNWDDDGDGLTDNEGDCDDGDASVRPGAPEVANGVDDDCDGVVDDGVADLDRDGYTIEQGDCDDDDGWVYPGAEEMCDEVDNNCDGRVDEDCGPVDTALNVIEPSTRCGCQATPSPLAWTGLLLLLPVVLRRRSS